MQQEIYMSFLPKMLSLPSLPGFGNAGAAAAKQASFPSAAKEQLSPTRQSARNASEAVGEMSRNPGSQRTFDQNVQAQAQKWLRELTPAQLDEVEDELLDLPRTAGSTDNQLYGATPLLNALTAARRARDNPIGR
jgi:hypothetical protein